MKVDLYAHWTIVFFDKITKRLDEEHRDNVILALEKFFAELGLSARRRRAQRSRAILATGRGSSFWDECR